MFIAGVDVVAAVTCRLVVFSSVCDQPPTPHYNWACAVDVVMQQHWQLVLEHLGGRSNLTQGIKLIKVWLAQRDLDKVRCCCLGVP